MTNRSQEIIDYLIATAEQPEVQQLGSAWERTDQIRELWRRCGSLKYTIPTDQLPFLKAISLNDVKVGDFVLPTECVRFDSDDMIGHIMKVPQGMAMCCSDGLMTTIWIDAANHHEMPISEWLDVNWSRSEVESRIDPVQVAEFRKRQHAFFSAIVSLLFLRNAHPEYFDFEVLRADRAAYDEARRRGDTDRMNAIEQRTIRRRGPHFTFNTGSSWVVDVPNPDDPVHYSPTHRASEHGHSYIVRGHLRRQRHGRGRAQVRIILIPPQIRRRDLIERENFGSHYNWGITTTR